MRLALANALHLRGMQGVDLAPALLPVLVVDPPCQRERLSKDLLQARISLDLAHDVADHPAQQSADVPQRLR